MIGNKITNMSYIYVGITIFAIILLVIYCVLIKEKEIWFVMLSVSIIIVNIGYITLALSNTLEEALLANRISYLGSVFLPMAMLIMILNICKVKYSKILPIGLLIISIFVFLVAASPGYLDIYYKKVSLERINGCTVLNKTYGAWHCLYLIYLIMYFFYMVYIVMSTSIKKKMQSSIYAIMLAGAVMVNIGVWLVGQLVQMEFEFLSVSYIISEFFMLCIYFMIQEQEKLEQVKEQKGIEEQNNQIVNSTFNYNFDNKENNVDNKDITTEDKLTQHEKEEYNSVVCEEVRKQFLYGISILTPKENMIYNYHIEGIATKDIMKKLDITENTLKYHNKNIYGKLGVSSRKELKQMAKQYQ